MFRWVLELLPTTFLFLPPDSEKLVRLRGRRERRQRSPQKSRCRKGPWPSPTATCLKLCRARPAGWTKPSANWGSLLPKRGRRRRRRPNWENQWTFLDPGLTPYSAWAESAVTPPREGSTPSPFCSRALRTFVMEGRY